MLTPNRRLLLTAACLFALACIVLPASAQAQDGDVDYRRAEMLLNWHTGPLISGDRVSPEWINGSDRFWYRNKTSTGHQFVAVNPASNSQGPLFDHYRLAAALSMANDTAYTPEKLPFDEFEFVDDDESRITFDHAKRRFECDLGAYTCMVGDTLPSETPFVESPDGQWEAFVMEHNVFVRSTTTGDTVQITTDGEEFNSYGLTAPRPNDVRNERVRRPQIVWAPDSQKLVVGRTDQRNVEHHHYVSYTQQRSRHYSQPYAIPGDTIVPTPGFHILDVEPAIRAVAISDSDGFDGSLVTNMAVEIDPKPNQLNLGGSAVDSVWSADGENLYISWITRASKSAYLASVDVASGATTIMARDTSKTFVETSQRDPTSWYVSDSTDDVFWWSERDGWAHIWRFDKEGNVKNQVTTGPRSVGAIQHVDEVARQLYFTAYGGENDARVPYYGQLYRVGFDGSGMTRVTDGEGKHEIEFSPSGRFFVDTYSQIGVPPVSVLRRAPSGAVVRTLEEADISRLVEVGWRAPEVFTVKARDGVTDIHGVIYFPKDAHDDGSYPVIDHIYPGPQVGSVGNWSFKGGGEDLALAELGFVVIQLDHMGTPQRSKAFHDAYYGDFNDNGLPDHITAIKQLAVRYPFMDLDRVGIYGHSGGGFASTDAMLRFPEFFSVAVSGAGNHDNASYNIYWSEKYQGLLEADSAKGTTNFTEEANKTHATELQGKLLLMHGDMDDNVHPMMTVQLIDALTKANKDYDLIWAPDRAHGLNEPYFIRRRWDYFVRHLAGLEPPREYEITRPTS